MSADIFNAWEVLAASTVATIITGGVAVAWAQGRLSVAQQYWAAGEAEFDKAEQLQAEVERTRNLPWYWPTDPDVTGEVLAIQPGHTYVVGEDGPVLLALSDLPHHDDEDAPHDDTERPYLWALVAAAIVLAPYAFARKQLGALVTYVRKRLKPNNEPYRGRHWVSDVQHTGQFPVINIPAQREGGDDL